MNSHIPDNLKYVASHEWLSTQNGIATVGITDHAQAELSDVVYVELPPLGKTLAAKAPAAVVESVKAASDIYAPVSGEVVAVNPALAADPALVNRSPYEQGWMFKLKIADPGELAALLDAAAYRAKLG
ncbi:MAG: glycine cleavage system protein GcvH [Verrucomicrobiales bacterium]|jgi:glycine cleavage system H protein|nr:glycine cleavage system protein GcvH [Verrucomicrobiales bacterium]